MTSSLSPQKGIGKVLQTSGRSSIPAESFTIVCSMLILHQFFTDERWDMLWKLHRLFQCLRAAGKRFQVRWVVLLESHFHCACIQKLQENSTGQKHPRRACAERRFPQDQCYDFSFFVRSGQRLPGRSCFFLLNALHYRIASLSAARSGYLHCWKAL